MRNDSRLGQVVGGYRLAEVLASGSTSTVFLGEHVHLSRRAAVKLLTESISQDKLLKARTLKEARVVNDIKHPNIGDIFDFIDEPPRLALVMELIEGPSMLNLRGHNLPISVATSLSLQLVGALAAAHELGIIHRDLKASNVMFTANPLVDPDNAKVKVVDFGIAKVLGPGEEHLTARGVLLGTPAYMAPEQASGGEVSPATDVYAVAELIYELFTGRRLFPIQAPQDTLRTKLDGGIPEIVLPPGAASLRQWLQKSLARGPKDRPEISALRTALGFLAFDDVESTVAAEPKLNPSDATVLDSPALKKVSDRPPVASEAPTGAEAPATVVDATVVAAAHPGDTEEEPEFTRTEIESTAIDAVDLGVLEVPTVTPARPQYFNQTNQTSAELEDEPKTEFTEPLVSSTAIISETPGVILQIGKPANPSVSVEKERPMQRREIPFGIKAGLMLAIAAVAAIALWIAAS